MNLKMLVLRYVAGGVMLVISPFVSGYLGTYGFLVPLIALLVLGLIGDVIVLFFSGLSPVAASMIMGMNLFSIPIIWIFLIFDIGNLLMHLPIVSNLIEFIPALGIILRLLFSNIVSILVKGGIFFFLFATQTDLVTQILNTKLVVNI